MWYDLGSVPDIRNCLLDKSKKLLKFEPTLCKRIG